MDVIKFLIDFIIHIDVHLGSIISTYGLATYVILFLIIFMETGLVFTPFLPGDSLLFAAGAFAALNSLNIFVLWIVLLLAALIGNTSNYWIGYFFGKKIVAHPRIPIDEEHIKETKKFFDKYGGKTIIIARFMPFVRTFAPFVAGVSRMSYKQFISYDLIGAFSWVTVGTVAGYFFGNIRFVRENFSLVIFGVIIISLLPIVFEICRKKLLNRKS
ncbi:MAG: DedA family protein [Candidatus Roizmanbacteria bacterium]|nr:DedA family protein [Candidatus Roizmanbacteria bacterium]MCR4313050.1 DedA family protein [Candidatus Roizmanbacteria bacterium]